MEGDAYFDMNGAPFVDGTLVDGILVDGVFVVDGVFIVDGVFSCTLVGALVVRTWCDLNGGSSESS